jgi:hypothetical protein
MGMAGIEPASPGLQPGATTISATFPLRRRIEESFAHSPFPLLSQSDIRATFAAIAQQEEHCAITGQLIQPQQSMWLGLTTTGELIPLSVEIRRGESTKL